MSKEHLIQIISLSIVLTIILSGCVSAPPPTGKPSIVKTIKAAYPDHFEMEFEFIKGGCFQMGCSDNDESCRQIEKPRHDVCVETLWMAKHEVTRLQFLQFKTEYEKHISRITFPIDIEDEGFTRTWTLRGPKIPLEKSEPYLLNHPITNVSWYGAKAMAEWIALKTGYQVRLPTEAEWEYACRAGKNDFYYGTSTGKWSYEIANYTSSHIMYHYIKSFPVASFPPNAFGIYDLSGNVYEWCEDWFDNTYYNRSPTQSPLQTAESDYKVVRGGAHASVAYGLKCTTRHGFWPDVKSSDTGIRLVVIPDINQLPMEMANGTDLILRIELESFVAE